MSAPALDPDLEAPTTGAVIGTDAERPATVDELAAELVQDLAEASSLLDAKLRLQAMVVRVEKRQRAEVEHRNGGGSHAYQYADLAEDVHEVLMPVLTGLGLLWETLPTLNPAGAFVLQYTLTHVPSREAQGGEWPLGPTNATAQAKGSDVTYGRRYALLAALGIAPRKQDDDGRAQRDEQRGGGQQQQRTNGNGGGQQQRHGGGQPARPASGRAAQAVEHAKRILANSDVEVADKGVAWIDANGWERERVRIPDADRLEHGLTDQAPTLRDIAQARSKLLHERADELAHAQRNRNWSDAADDRSEQLEGEASERPQRPDEDNAGDPWADAPLAGSDAARTHPDDAPTDGETTTTAAPAAEVEQCGAPTVGDTPCTGVYDPTIGQCTGLSDHDLNASWDDDEPDTGS